MLTGIIFSLIGLTLSLRAMLSLWKDGERTVCVAFGVVVTATIWLLGDVAALCIGAFAPIETAAMPSRIVPLVAMRSADTSAGSFLSFRGETDVIFWVNDHGLRQRRLRMGDRLKFFEEDRSDGVLEVHDRHFIGRAWQLFALDDDIHPVEYWVRVPKGAVTRGYEVQ